MPNDQAPLFNVPGPHGGWFASLLYGYVHAGDATDPKPANAANYRKHSPPELLVPYRKNEQVLSALFTDNGAPSLASLSFGSRVTGVSARPTFTR